MFFFFLLTSRNLEVNYVITEPRKALPLVGWHQLISVLMGEVSSVELTFLCQTQAGGTFIPPMKGELKQHTVLSLTEPTALAGDYLYF